MPRVLNGSFGSSEVDIGAVEYAYGLFGIDLSDIDTHMYLVGAVYPVH